MRAARLHQVEVRVVVVIGGQSHAAGVDDEPAVVELADARLVRVPAQDQRGLHLAGPLDGLVMRGRAHAARAVAAEIRRHGLEEIAQVVVRRAVAAEHVAGRTHAGRQRREPAALRRGQPQGGMAVGCAHAFERTQDLALVVAADRGQGKRHQAVGRLHRPQGSRDDVAEVDDEIHLRPGDVRQHRLQGRQVAVDVGDGGQAHGTSGSYLASWRRATRRSSMIRRASSVCASRLASGMAVRGALLEVRTTWAIRSSNCVYHC